MCSCSSQKRGIISVAICNRNSSQGMENGSQIKHDLLQETDYILGETV